MCHSLVDLANIPAKFAQGTGRNVINLSDFVDSEGLISPPLVLRASLQGECLEGSFQRNDGETNFIFPQSCFVKAAFFARDHFFIFLSAAKAAFLEVNACRKTIDRGRLDRV